MDKITKDSNTRRVYDVYNFKKPRPPQQKTPTDLVATLQLTKEDQIIQDKANKLLSTITYE